MICRFKWPKKLIVIGTILSLSWISLVFAQDNSLKGSSALLSLFKSRKKAQQEQQPTAANNTAQSQALALTPVQQDSTSTGTDQYDPRHLYAASSSPLQEKAFQNLSRQALPMSPGQIVQLKQMLAEAQRASAAPADTPPRPVLTTQIANLAPGSIPPVIRLQQGFVTSIVFVDASGANWPIVSCNLGNPKAFNLLQWEPGSNTIKIQALSMYTYGNLAVNLKGLSTPVMLTLMPGQKTVDYRVDLRIPRLGPESKPDVSGAFLPASANNILLSVLDGVAPPGAKPLDVEGGDCQAWEIGNKMYLRTELTVLSPSWIAVMSSPDGTKAYEMVKSPDVLVSKYGKTMNLSIKER
jgi:intracellular multiplication protein IcmK